MDILQVACLAYGGPGRTALVFSPTYPLYARFAILAATAVADEAIGVPYHLEAGRVREAIARHRPSLVFFASPNNPTGNLIDPGAVLGAADAAPDALVVVDEAYAEFAGSTMLPARAERPNLAFVKTLSKVDGAAGLRVGALIAAPEIVDVFLVAANAWTVDAITATVALRILEQPEELRQARVARIRGERERVASRLRRIEGVEVFPSDASFLLFRARTDSARVSASLAERGILVRDVSPWGAANCVRVTIGTHEENDAFLDSLAPILDAVPAA
jgi:histidinol-phosphate aminotransferase